MALGMIIATYPKDIGCNQIISYVRLMTMYTQNANLAQKKIGAVQESGVNLEEFPSDRTGDTVGASVHTVHTTNHRSTLHELRTLECNDMSQCESAGTY